jgi:hypothetical protein
MIDEDLKSILESNWDETVVGKPRIVLSREVRMIDLQAGDIIVIDAPTEEEEFFGIGATDYLKRARCALHIRTSVGAEQAKKMLQVVRSVLRKKENWSGWALLRFAALESLMDREKKIYSFTAEVEAIKSESV